MRNLLSDINASWTDHFDARPDAARLGDRIRLEDLPTLPLARTVRMPAGYAYSCGALGLRVQGLTLSGLRSPVARAQRREGDAIIVELLCAPLQISGRHAIMAKPDPIVAIDAAGNLMDLEPAQLEPARAGAAAGHPPVSPEQEIWLTNARNHRAKLAMKPNGQILLGAYSEHNETFAEVMANPTVQTNWQAGGATKAMAADTNAALDSGGVINDSSRTYGGASYNANAFSQQLQVALGCVLIDPTSNFGQNQPAEDSKYWSAAKAALSFGKTITSSTGVHGKNDKELHGAAVYDVVDTHSGEPNHVSSAEAWQVLSDGDGGGGRDAGATDSWIVIDEADHARLARFKAALLQGLAADASVVGAPLFEGSCGARIEGARIELIWRPGACDTVAAEIFVPPFEFEIDDSGWTDDAGAIARQRVEAMHYIRILVHETLLRGLRGVAREIGGASCRATMTV